MTEMIKLDDPRKRTGKDKTDILAVVLREELTALRTWQHAILPYDVQDGIVTSIDKIIGALKEAGYKP